MVFFMLGGALRSAGDARTPMMLGIAMTVLNLVLNVVLIRGLGPIPAFGTSGSAMGTCIAGGLLALYAVWRLWSGGWVVSFPRGRGLGPDWTIIRTRCGIFIARHQITGQRVTAHTLTELENRLAGGEAVRPGEQDPGGPAG